MCVTSGRTAILSMQRGPVPESPGAPGPTPRIGAVIFTTHRGERAEAILDAEGRWRCPRLPVLDRVLNILFEPKRGSTGLASFGHAELDRVAAWIKGRVCLGHGDEGGSS